MATTVKEQWLDARSLPPQVVHVDPISYNVLGQQGPFRQNASSEFFNPTNSPPPVFQVFHPSFLEILGKNPSIRAVASKPDFAFAHEAPIWVSDTDEVYFASNSGGPLGQSDINHNNQVSKISLKDVDAAIKAAGDKVVDVEVTVTKVGVADTAQMINGGTGPYDGCLLLANSGRGSLPPSLALVDPKSPYTTKVILDNYLGRQFNSINDVVIHPISKNIFFTDVTYGYRNAFRPAPLMPNQVYRFDPSTGSVRVVADGFDKCNGIAFTQDGLTAYVTDTGSNAGVMFPLDQTAPATVYAYDVDPKSEQFKNRRVFAYADAGIPDGIQPDTKGNIYTGCGDGVQVYNPDGMLIGKIFLGSVSGNLTFAGKGRLVIMAETKIYYAQIEAEGIKLYTP